MSGGRLLVVLGNQLFPTEYLADFDDAVVFMAEDVGLCTYVRHHQQKIVLFLAAMRSYADELRAAGFEVRYHKLNPGSELKYEELLGRDVRALGVAQLLHFEVEDKFMEKRLLAFCDSRELPRRELPSPMFLDTRENFRRFAKGRSRLLMADYYKLVRQRSGILVGAEGDPVGGRWSFDTANRRKLPKDILPPEVSAPQRTQYVNEVIPIVAREFAAHPGRAADFWWPTTREQSRTWLNEFVEQRLELFGPYEDAISRRTPTVFHSLLSPMLNIGLLLPSEVANRVLEHFAARECFI